MSQLPPDSRLLRRERKKLRDIFGLKACRPPNVCTYPRTTAGTLRVNYHQSLQVFLPRPSLLGSLVQLRVPRRSLGYLKDTSSASPQSRKRAHQWSLNHWTRQYHRHPVFAMPFIQSSLAPFPTDSSCRIPTTRCYLFTKKMSRPYEMGKLTVWVKVDPASILECHLVNLDCANPIFRDAQDRRHSSPILNIVSTATYLIGYASRGGSAF